MSSYGDMRANITRRALLDMKRATGQVTLTGESGWRSIGRVQMPGDTFGKYNVEKLLRVYSKSDIVFACVKEKAGSVSEGILELGRVEDDGFKPVESHELLDLFYDNPNYAYAELLELMVARLELSGASFSLLDGFKNRTGVSAFVPVPTNLIEIETKGPVVTGYKFQNGDTEESKTPEEVAAHRKPMK